MLVKLLEILPFAFNSLYGRLLFGIHGLRLERCNKARGFHDKQLGLIT